MAFRQLYNRALEIAFMAFSERESDTYAKELAHETAREVGAYREVGT